MVNTFDVFNWLNAGNVKPNKDSLKLSIKLLQEELGELQQALEEENAIMVMDGVADTKWILDNILYHYGIQSKDFSKYCEAVSESNWSKYCNLYTAEKSVSAYLSGTHPDKPGERIQAHMEQSENGLWVIKRHDGKILKSINYKKPSEFI